MQTHDTAIVNIAELRQHMIQAFRKARTAYHEAHRAYFNHRSRSTRRAYFAALDLYRSTLQALHDGGLDSSIPVSVAREGL